MATVVVTVGMGRWPFDRLVVAVDQLVDRHQVFVQTGTSTLRPRCEHQAWVPPEELHRRMLAADVVVTHAGNTVRWLQRRGKVPVAVARTAALGEMANDHQVRYLRDEQDRGPVLAVWDVAELGRIVDHHAELAAEVAGRPVPEPVDPAALVGQLDGLARRSVVPGPFTDHPVRRYDFAWHQLAERSGRHLDLGCNAGQLLGALTEQTDLQAVGVDANDEVLAQARAAGLPVARTDRWGRLPFAADTFDSASVLDVLEHVPDEAAVLAELHRVLRPGGLLVASVPARHLLSALDPDNVKLRFPRLHGAVYRARFGEQRYRDRFVDLRDGYLGDLAVERHDHTNFEPEAFLSLLRDGGFEPFERDGANLWWRIWQPVELLGTGRLQRAAERLTLWDGRRFRSANLFVAATAT